MQKPRVTLIEAAFLTPVDQFPTRGRRFVIAFFERNGANAGTTHNVELETADYHIFDLPCRKQPGSCVLHFLLEAFSRSTNDGKWVHLDSGISLNGLHRAGRRTMKNDCRLWYGSG